MNQVIISIIVPCYNVEKYLGKCVTSVLEQSNPNWELILVDDGSKDKTPFLCDMFASKDKRVKVIHKNNGGLVSSRNVGFENSSGNWVMYVDGDDWIALDTVQKLQDSLQIYDDIDVFFWNNIQELGEKSLIKEKWHCNDYLHLYEKEECKMLAKNVLVYTSNIASACTKLINRNFCIKNNLIHNPKLCQGVEGVEFSLRVFGAAHRVVYLNEFLYHYRFNPTSISKRIDERNTKFIYEGFCECKKYVDSLEKDKNSFIMALHDRVIHAIIAVSMSTYFHPSNKESILKRTKKFANVVKLPLFKETIKSVPLSYLDRKRAIVLLLMKLHLYILIEPIAYLKYFMLKNGYFNY